jgi:hypothetical protein
VSGTKRLWIYLKSAGAGLFNLFFVGVIVLYTHMAAVEARFHAASRDAGHWDPVFFIKPVWWVVIGLFIFIASFYREFRKLTRKPNP